MANEWAIMDSEGIIFRGTEDEIRTRWSDRDTIYKEADSVHGDLELIEIHETVN